MPEPGPGEVLVRVRATGLCGSDLHFWKYAVYGEGVTLGHEIAGEVAALGEGVERLSPGQLGVVYAGIPCGRCARCRAGLAHYCQEGHSLGTGGPFGGFGEYLLTPAENFLAAPEGSDPALLTFSEPLANGLRCLDHPEVREAGSAVVIGGGVLLIGAFLGSIEVLPVTWMLKELTIRSSLGCSREQQRQALDWVTADRPDARPLVTRRIGMEQVQDTLVDLASGADEIKVVIEHDRRS